MTASGAAGESRPPRGAGGREAEAAAWADDQLVRQVVERSSQRHFALLMSRYQEKVLRLAASVLGPELVAHAEDAVQAAFARAFTALPGFRGEASFSTWLYRLAYNCSVDLRRKLRRQSSREISLPPGDCASAAASPEAQRQQAQQDRLVRAAVDRLPPSHRIIVRLYYWQELSVAEIADILAANPSTIKSYLYRARQRLAQLLVNDP